MTWEIFLGIAALVAFTLTFMKISRDLTGAVTRLSCAVEKLDENQINSTKRLDSHGKQIDDHEKRLVRCEEKLKKTEEKVNYFHDV